MSIQLVVFDMAGTTVHDGNAVLNSFRDALAAAGLSATDEAINAVMGLRKPDAVRLLTGPNLPQSQVDAIHNDFVAHECRPTTKKTLPSTKPKAQVQCLPGSIERVLKWPLTQGLADQSSTCS